MSAPDLLLSFLLTLALHATVLLGAAWLLERLGALEHPGWAELAWRTALLGALLSAALEFTAWPRDAAAPREATAAALSYEASEADPTPSSGSAAMPADAPAAVSGPTRRSADTLADSLARAATPAPTRQTADNGAAAATAWSVPDLVAIPMLVLWFAGLAVGALRLLAQTIAVRRLAAWARRHGAPAGPGLAGASARLADELDIAPPTLRLLPLAHGPMVLPGASVLLPSWADALPAAQQRAMLAHELSHLQRRDPAWRIVQRLAALPLFFHPLARHARRRLDALAEDACDARAAELLGSGRPLAECLATCLSHAGARAGQPALAVAMAGDAGTVVRRVRNLLENRAMPLTPLSPGARRSAIVLALAAIIALPGLAITSVASEGFGDRIMSRLDLDGRQNYSYSSRSPRLKVGLRLSGEVTLNDDETNVVRLGKGAHMELEETRDGVKRELHVFGKDGVIQRRYWLEGDEVAFDDEARRWLAATLPALIRDSGINAEARGKRILAKGGPDALLADMAHLRTDYAQATYLRVLYANATLDDVQLGKSLDIAKGIESDFELRQALQSALSSQRLSPAHRVRLLGLASEISSDFELAELLRSLADEVPADGPTRAAWQQALSGISSDFEHRRVLEAVLGQPDLTPDAVQLVLESAAGISSDFELRSVLEKTARHTRGNPAALAAYAARTAEVSSDFEARQALVALVEAGPVDLAVADTVLEAVGNVSSDFEASQVLRTLAARMPADDGLVKRYREQARSLGDHERGQAEKALDRFAIAG